MTEELYWTNDTRKLGELQGWAENPRTIDEDEAARLEESLVMFGQIHPIAIDPNNVIVDGHQRWLVWKAAGFLGEGFTVEVRVANRELTEEERQQLTIYLHEGTTGKWNLDILKGWEKDTQLEEWGMKAARLRLADKKGSDDSAAETEGESSQFENSEYEEGENEAEGKPLAGQIQCPHCGKNFWKEKND